MVYQKIVFALFMACLCLSQFATAQEARTYYCQCSCWVIGSGDPASYQNPPETFTEDEANLEKGKLCETCISGAGVIGFCKGATNCTEEAARSVDSVSATCQYDKGSPALLTGTLRPRSSAPPTDAPSPAPSYSSPVSSPPPAFDGGAYRNAGASISVAAMAALAIFLLAFWI